MTTERVPKIVRRKHLLYLDRLRESGQTNMYGAGPYVEREFGLSAKHAETVVGYWMRTFAARHGGEK